MIVSSEIFHKRRQRHSRDGSRRQMFSTAFDANGEIIKVLNSPTEFFETLVHRAKTARRCIILSALYFGNGDLEKQLINTIDEALSDISRPDLTCTIILDYSRANRGKINSLSMLKSVVSKHGDRMKLLLYRMPQCTGFINSLFPGQMGEIFGVYHCKFSVFDEDVILSGANLSDEYFRTRQDRYLLVEGSTGGGGGGGGGGGSREKCSTESVYNIQSYLLRFVSILSPFCCRVVRMHMEEVEKEASPNKQPLIPPGVRIVDGLRILPPEKESTDTMMGVTGGLFPRLFHSRLAEELRNSLLPTQASASSAAVSASHTGTATTNTMAPAGSTTIGTTTGDSSTRVYPMIQHYNCGIEEESRQLSLLISPLTLSPASLSQPSVRHQHQQYKQEHHHSLLKNLSSQWDRIVVSSPYPSFMQPFTEALLSAATNATAVVKPGTLPDFQTRSGDVTIIVPHTSAHGFATGGGFKSLIPKMHSRALSGALLSSLSRMYVSTTSSSSAASVSAATDKTKNSAGSTNNFGHPLFTEGVSLAEYSKPGWTFHSKGIWAYKYDVIAEGYDTTAAAPKNRSSSRHARAVSAGVGCGVDDASHSVQGEITSNQTFAAPTVTEAATYIGSSNFGQRSWRRDFELGFVLHTHDKHLIRELHNECDRLLALCNNNNSSNSSGSSSHGRKGGSMNLSSSPLLTVKEFVSVHRARTKWQDLGVGFLTKLLRTYL